MNLRLGRRIVLFLLIAVGPELRAESPQWPVDRGPAPVAALAYDKTLLKSIPAAFLDDAPACVLYSGTTHHLLTNGTIESTSQELIRLNRRKGFEQFGEYKTITFCPSHEKVTLHGIRVHKTNGSIVQVGPEHLHVRDVNTEHQIYDPSKQLVISFPGLEVGDVIDIHWTTRGKHPEFQGQYFNRYMFGHDKYPVVRDEWTIRIPKERPLRHAMVNGEVPLTVRDEGNDRIYHWAGKNFAPPPQGERLPPADERQIQVFASTFDTWEDVFRWERNLIVDRSECPPAGKKVIDEITKGLTDPIAKARALTQWMREHVRYVSSGKKHDYTPHPPARVLAHRYGDCKDTAHLLAVLLREAGLQAGVATLGVRGDGQIHEAVPSPWGSHALCVVTIDGEDHWIDTTAQMLGWDVLPKDDRDRACYITDGKTIRMTRTPALTPPENTAVQTNVVSIKTDGTIQVERVAEYRGLAAWDKRDDFVDVPAVDQRRIVAADLTDGFPKARIKNLSFENLAEYDKPFIVKTAFEEPEHFAGDKVREGSLGDVSLWQQILGISINPERKASLDFGEPFASVCRYVIELPPTLRLAQIPSSQRLMSPWGTFKLDVKFNAAKPHRLELVFDTRISKTRVEPADFGEFQSFVESLQACFRATLKLKPTEEAADAPLIEAILARSPGDADAAAILADIYIAQRRFDDARRVLAQARAASPHVKRLWELSVAAADGPEEEEDLLRSLVERFKDDPKFAISLAQNLFEQGKAQEARTVLEPLRNHTDKTTRYAALIELAQICIAQDEPKMALKYLKAAEDADTAGFTVDGWCLRAEALEALGQRDQALNAYRKALEKDPEDADVLTSVIRLSLIGPKREDALPYLHKLAAIAGDEDHLYALAAEGLARLGRFDEATELANRTRDPAGQMPDAARLALGLALAHRGEAAKAIEMLKSAEPDSDVLIARIGCRLALGELTAAINDVTASKSVEEPSEELQKLCERVQSLMQRCNDIARNGVPRTGVENFVCAEYFSSSDRSPELVTALVAKALAGQRPIGQAFGLRAVIHADRGRLAKGLADAEKAIELAPTDYRGFLARGRVKFERGDSTAIADLQKAAELSSRKDASVLHGLAAALAQSGKRDDAIVTQREAIKLRPNVAEYQEQLREIEGRK